MHDVFTMSLNPFRKFSLLLLKMAVWTSFEERVDKEGNPAPLALPLNYFYF